MQYFYLLILGFFILNSTAQAETKPSDANDTTIRVKGLHTTKNWPETRFPDSTPWVMALKEDPHPADKACVEKQLQEIQKLFIPQANSSLSQSLKNQKINQVEIQIQYGMDLQNGPTASLEHTQRFQMAGYKFWERRTLKVAAILPYIKRGDNGACLVTNADLIAKALLNPNMNIGNRELAMMRLMDRLNAPAGMEQRDLIQDTSLAAECGVQVMSKTEITSAQMKCMEEKMRQSISHPVQRRTAKTKASSATNAASSASQPAQTEAK